MLNQTPVQIAWVARDLDATERTLSAMLGARSWVRMPGVHFAPDQCTYRGEPADFTADIALSYAGDMQLELIAPVSGHSMYTEFLDTVGPGLHHICVETPDDAGFDAALADAKARGAPVLQEGVMPGGMRFAYVSADTFPVASLAPADTFPVASLAPADTFPVAPLAPAEAGVPFVEIAFIPPEIRAFFDYIKQEQK